MAHKLNCPECEHIIIDDDVIGEALTLGVRRLDLIDLVRFVNRAIRLENDLRLNNKRIRKIVDKLGDDGWNVLEALVVKRG